MDLIHKIKKSLVSPIVGSAYFSKKYYYKSYRENTFNKYRDTNTYLELFEKCKKRIHICGNQKIRFSSKLDFDCQINDFKSTNFSTVHLTEELDACSILIGRTRIGDFRAKATLCFFNNKLFTFNYSFSNLLESDKEKIIDTIQEKYLGNKVSFDIATQAIKDDFGNFIFIEDGVSFRVHYLSLKQEINNYFANLKELSVLHQKTREEIKKKDLYTKL